MPRLRGGRRRLGWVMAVLCSLSVEEPMGVWTLVKTGSAGTCPWRGLGACPGSCLPGIDNHTPNISLCLQGLQRPKWDLI